MKIYETTFNLNSNRFSSASFNRQLIALKE
jgi:hypothetical protein